MADFRPRAENRRAAGGRFPDAGGQELVCALSGAQHSLVFNKRNYPLQPGQCFQLGHDKKLQAFGRGAHGNGVDCHDAEVGVHADHIESKVA